MANTIEGRLRLSVFDSIALAALGMYLINVTLAQFPWWAAILIGALLIGVVVTIHSNRIRNLVVKYDDNGVRLQYKTLLGEQKKEHVAWHKVYGIERIPHKAQVGLIGQHGDVLLSVPDTWKGLGQFNKAVTQQMEQNDQLKQQLDFCLPRIKFSAFSPPVLTLLTIFVVSILQELVFPSGNQSLWQNIRYDVTALIVVTLIGLCLQGYRLTSLHIGERELVLKYPHITRRLRYQDIASVDLVEDPSQPVVSEVRRIRINLKGRSRYYHISEFPSQAVTIHQRINQRLGAKTATGDIRSQSVVG